MTISEIIAKRLDLRQQQVENTMELLEGGATIPFISRYRKEATGGLNEVQVTQINDLNTQLGELVHRREYILETIEAQGKLTDALRQRISECWDATVLEDIYLPFKPKRKTRAEAARQKGLEPLAQQLMLTPHVNPMKAAEKFVTEEVPDVEAALQGARDIIAEHVSEDERTRQTLRHTFERTAVISSKVVKSKMEEAGKFRDYFDWQEPLRRCSSHRLLAMRRGEAEGFLRLSIAPANDEETLSRLSRHYVKPGTPAASQMQLAMADAYKRLLRPSIENEFATSSKQKADDEAILVFAENLKQLLLAAPLGQRRIMASTLASERAARWCVLTRRAISYTMKRFIPINRKTSGDALPAASPRWQTNMPLKPSPSATERRDAKRNSSCAKRILRMSTFSW